MTRNLSCTCRGNSKRQKVLGKFDNDIKKWCEIEEIIYHIGHIDYIAYVFYVTYVVSSCNFLPIMPVAV